MVVLETLGYVGWNGAQDGVRGEFLRWFPPYSLKALWRPNGEQFANAPGEHSTALVSVVFCVLFWVGTIWGKGGIPQVVPPLLH